MSKQTIGEIHIPTVVEKNDSFDIYSRLLKDRIIFLSGGINEEIASVTIAQLLFLHKQNAEEEIHFYIMSEGGSALASFAIYDTMKHISNPIATYCVGYAFSAGAFLVSSGTKGRRFSLPSAKIMIHEPWCEGISGNTDDIQIEAEQSRITKQMLLSYLSENCEKDIAEMEKICQKDRYFLPEEAKNFGLIDKIVSRKKPH